jgi:hypothetical protein
MNLVFATCERRRALGFLRKLYPGCAVDDTPGSAGPLLDLVEADVLRISDPDFHGGTVFPGKNWGTVPADESKRVLMAFHEAAMATPTPTDRNRDE